MMVLAILSTNGQNWDAIYYDSVDIRFTMDGTEYQVNTRDHYGDITLLLASNDSDSDGVNDAIDAFPDPAESVDSDGDGVGDNADAFPNVHQIYNYRALGMLIFIMST